MQYQGEDAAAEQAEGGAAQEETKLAEQVFPPDEHGDQPFIWKEQPLRKGFRRPVVLHTANFGTIERFMAILMEKTEGKWPFFMSPRQIMVIPSSPKANAYCESVYLYYH